MNNKIVTLHRYFLNASRIKRHFDELLEENVKRLRKGENIITDKFQIEAGIYMSLWYSTLYVVIEGWKSLELTDAQIDPLVKSKYVSRLHDFRNATFHYIPTYQEPRINEFFKETEAADWIQNLHKAFSNYFKKTLT